MIRQKLAKLKKPSAGLLAALLIAGGGMAFALLQTQNTMTGNTISSESANMLISQNDANYSMTTAGYNFTGVIPGEQPSQTEHFMLKNTGTAPLALKMSLTSTPTNSGGVDLSKVHILLIPFDTVTYMPHTSTPQDFTVQSLVDAGPGGLAVEYPSPLAASTKEEFNVKVAMDDGAVGNNGATIGNIDLGFTGTAVAN